MTGRHYILLLLLLATNTLALDCQYIVNETYVTKEDALVLENSFIKKADPLNITDFVSGEQYAFTIFNPNKFDLGVSFSYNISGHITGQTDKGAKIQAMNYTLFKQYCYDGSSIGNCSLDPASVSYFVTSPEVMFLKQIDVQKNREICKSCVEKTCLNDGAICTMDSECGSTICSIAKTCTHNRVIPCPDGLANCNNQSCLRPSSKNVGDTYACEFECTSGIGNNSMCVMNADMVAQHWADFVKGLIFFLLFTLFIAVVLLIAAWYVKRKGLDPLTSRMAELTSIIEEDNQIISETEAKISSLQEETTNANGKARKILENALEREGELLSEQRQKMAAEKRELDKKSKELDEKYSELDLKFLRELKSRYHNMALNSEGYPVFSNNPRNSIHRYIYKKNFEEIYQRKFDESQHVHHIDANKLNSLDVTNLIDITEKQHKRIPHWKIKRGNWNQGLKVMMDALDWDESDLPKHIREHLRD